MRPITHVNEQPVATLPAHEQRDVHRKQLGQFYDMKDKAAGNRPNGIVEAGILHPAIQKLFDSKIAAVLLSDDNIRKNIDHHHERYQAVPEGFASAAEK